MRITALLLALAAAAASHGASKEAASPPAGGDSSARVAAYLDEPDDKAAEERLKALLAGPARPAGEWEALVRSCRAFRASPAGIQERRAVLRPSVVRLAEARKRMDKASEAKLTKAYREQAKLELKWLEANLFPGKAEAVYAVRIPKGYDPAKAHPLILALHGANGSGPAFIRGWDASGDLLDRKGVIVVAPTAAAKVGWTNCLAGHEVIRATLAAAMREFRVDPDAVYADGMSMGGAGAWRLLASHADWFAGAVSRSGPPLTDAETPLIENAKGMRLLLYSGLADRLVPIDYVRKAATAAKGAGLDVRSTEAAGRGHDPFRDKNAEILDRLLEVRRDPARKDRVLAAASPLVGRNHFVEILEAPEGELRHDQLYLTPGGDVLESRKMTNPPMRAAVSFQEGNRIRVDTRGVRRLRIYLSPALADLAKPVTVTLNGRALPAQTAEPSPALLLRQARLGGPLQPVVHAFVELEAP